MLTKAVVMAAFVIVQPNTAGRARAFLKCLLGDLVHNVVDVRATFHGANGIHKADLHKWSRDCSSASSTRKVVCYVKDDNATVDVN
jgi:hypothetical protein